MARHSIRPRPWTLPANSKRDEPEERTAWVLDYNDNEGNRHIKTFKRKRDAQAYWDNELSTELADGTHTPPRTSITVAEAGELWIEQCKIGHDGGEPLERSTVRQYEQHLKHINQFIGGIKLPELTPGTVTSFQNRLIKNGRSRVMARKVVGSLGALLTTAQAHGRVVRNVVRDRPRARKGTAKRHKKRPEVGVDIPTKDELRAILDAADGRWRPIIVTVVFTGLRASEIRGLAWDHVDFDANVIRVRQRADRFNKIGPPKTAAGVRDVPMAPMVANTLKEWQVACPKGGLDLVFPNGKGNIENLANIYRRGLGTAQVAAGITDEVNHPKYGLHAFRHAAASLFIEQRFTPKRIQAIMGHSSIQITYDVYGHLFPSPDDDAAAMAQLEARLVG